MAFICSKPRGSCPRCEHFRYDEDHMRKCCWAEYDRKHPNSKPRAPQLIAGLTFWAEGDSQDMWLNDYNCRVSSYFKLLETPRPNAKKALVLIDNIDGDYEVTATMRLSYIKAAVGIN